MLYLVMVIRKPNFQSAIMDAHRSFLENLKRNDQLVFSGGFTDKTGGAYVINAQNREEATAIAYTDPLHTSGSSKITIHEWDVR